MLTPTIASFLIVATATIFAVAGPAKAQAVGGAAPVLSKMISDGDTHRIDATHSTTGSNEGPVAISARSNHLVIFFHGIRGRGAVMASIGNSWQSTLPDTEFVSPDAPFPHRSGGHQWFVIDDQALRPDRIQAARRAFDDLVADIIRREGFDKKLDKVAFVGVSQGAIMALDAVSTGRWKIGALVSFAGLLPLPPVSSQSRTAILLMHGGADKTIPSTASAAACNQLKSAGYDVTLKVFPAVGHTISEQQAEEAALFLRDRLD